jgi:hypothetical protein
MTISEILNKHALLHVNVFSYQATWEYAAAIEILGSYTGVAQIERAERTGFPNSYKWEQICHGGLNWEKYIYRIAPTCRPKETRPWEKPEDVPVEAEWLRIRGYPDTFRITGLMPAGMSIGNYPLVPWAKLNNEEWSDRERKVWHPCETEVVA